MENIYDACKAGDMETIIHMFNMGVKCNARLLNIASEYGQLAQVVYFELTTPDLIGANYNSLCWAAFRGHLQVVRYFVEELCICMQQGDKSALYYASYTGHLPVVKYLILYGADIAINDNNSFIIASENGHLSVVEYLYNQDVDMSSKLGTALNRAATKGHLPIVKYLVKKGLNSETYTDALNYAAEHGRLSVVKFLVKMGVNGTARALRVACYKNHINIVKFLGGNGVNVRLENGAFFEMIQRGHISIFEYFIEQDIDIHYKNDRALICASKYGALPMVISLIKHGAHIHAQQDEALNQAIIQNHQDIFIYLMEHGADINAQNGSILKNATATMPRKVMMRYLV